MGDVKTEEINKQAELNLSKLTSQWLISLIIHLSESMLAPLVIFSIVEVESATTFFST